MKLGATAIVIAGMLALTGCATSAPETKSATSSASPSTSAAQERSPRQAWDAAIATTSTAGGVSLEGQIVTNVEGFERITMGQGYVDIPSASGDLTWTDERSEIREVRTPSGHFVGFDGLWYSENQDIPTTIAMTPLAGLDAATDITEGPTTEVLGTPTKELRATLEPNATLMGVSTEELTVMDPSTGSMSATIWVDDSDRIVRIVRQYRTVSLDGDPIEASVLFLLSDFGTEQPIDVPETADAIPAPD